MLHKPIRRQNHYLLIYTTLLVACLGSTLLACSPSGKSSMKAYNQAGRLKPFDAIIVPGIPFKNGHWDSTMKARVLWSYILYKNGYTCNIIYSGAAVYSPYKESVIMGLYARQLGIPARHIFCDTQAYHSTENVYYSYLIAQQQGFKTIALATDPGQSTLLRSFTRRRFASPIFHLPFIEDSIKAYNYLNPTIDPASAHVDNFVSIVDKESMWHRLGGTLGRDINFKQYKHHKVSPL